MAKEWIKKLEEWILAIGGVHVGTKWLFNYDLGQAVGGAVGQIAAPVAVYVPPIIYGAIGVSGVLWISRTIGLTEKVQKLMKK